MSSEAFLKMMTERVARGGHYYDVQVVIMTYRSSFRIISAFIPYAKAVIRTV